MLVVIAAVAVTATACATISRLLLLSLKHMLAQPTLSHSISSSTECELVAHCVLHDAATATTAANACVALIM
jgi:hypothetical protein